MKTAAFGGTLGIILLCPSVPPPRQAAPEVYEAPDREPTPEETLILELMNRFRADPSVEADRIAPGGKSGGGVDWNMFRQEMKALKPAPPLVFNLELLDAARKHSWYMIRNTLTHAEEPGKPGFTGTGPAERMKAAGYRGFGAAENAFRDAPGPLGSHVGFVVDNGAGPGGMQPERGHRRNMIGPFREVGPGAVPHAGRLSVTHDFGTRDVRLAGGVVFIDLNGNNFYDTGEGLGGVTIAASDGSSTTTWKAGSYALELRGQGTVTLAAMLEGERFVRTFPAGRDNLKFDWAVPIEVPLRRADRYLAAVEHAGEPGTPRHTQALVNLYYHTRGLYLDPPRRTRIQELTASVGPELEAHQKAVLEALRNVEAPGLQKLLEDHRRPYRGTDADAWFQDAEMVARLKRGVANFLRQPRPPSLERRQMTTALEEARKKMRTLAFLAEIDLLIARLRS